MSGVSVSAAAAAVLSPDDNNENNLTAALGNISSAVAPITSTGNVVASNASSSIFMSDGILGITAVENQLSYTPAYYTTTTPTPAVTAAVPGGYGGNVAGATGATGIGAGQYWSAILNESATYDYTDAQNASTNVTAILAAETTRLNTHVHAVNAWKDLQETLHPLNGLSLKDKDLVSQYLDKETELEKKSANLDLFKFRHKAMNIQCEGAIASIVSDLEKKKTDGTFPDLLI